MTAIPRILHFVWLQGEVHLREHACEYWENVQLAKRLVGDSWDVRLWDEKSLESHIQNISPDVWRRFRMLDEPAMKADIARFVLLKEFGGVYVDVDFIIRNSPEPLCNLASGPYIALRRLRFGNFVNSLLNGTLSCTPESLQTYIIISAPGIPVWDFLLEHIASFRRRRLWEHPGVYYARYTSLHALGKAVHRYQTTVREPHPVIYITHVSEHYGLHVGRGEWAGMLTTHGRLRHSFAVGLNWYFVVSLVINVMLVLALAAAWWVF